MTLGFQERHFPVQVASQILNAATSFEIANTEHSIRPEGAGIVLQKAPRSDELVALRVFVDSYGADIPLGNDAVAIRVFDVKHRFKMRVFGLVTRTSKFDRELSNARINGRKMSGRCFLGCFLISQNLLHPNDSQKSHENWYANDWHGESKDAANNNTKQLPVLVDELGKANREFAKRKSSFWSVLLDMLRTRTRVVLAHGFSVSPNTAQPPEHCANGNQYQGRNHLRLEAVGLVEQANYCCSENKKRCHAKNSKPNEAKKTQHKNNLQKYWVQNLAKAQKRQSLHLTNRTRSSMVRVLRETEAGIDSPFDSRRSEPRQLLRGFLMAGRIGEPYGSPIPRDRSVNPMRPVTILTGGGWRNTFSRRATMSEQQSACAATQRKLLIDDIWTELTALEERLGDGQELAHTVITFAEILDHTDPKLRCFIALVGFWHDQQIESKKAFNRLVNRINELRDAA